MGSMKKIFVLLLVVLIATISVSPASAHHRPNHTKGGSVTTSPSILDIHNKVCLTVVEYANCANIKVTVDNLGPTGYTATSGPAAGTVTYNSYYAGNDWARTVAHEIGGHHDAWAEVSARGTNPWQDYYDLNVFAQQWLAAKGYSFSAERSKEIYLDCVGPFEHGYGNGNYAGSLAPVVCPDADTVMTRALTEDR